MIVSDALDMAGASSLGMTGKQPSLRCGPAAICSVLDREQALS